MPEARVLSIQSHVVHGYVGNKSAIFPLQILGFEVDVINSVQFSNHTGYPKRFTGQVLDGQELWNLIEGLEMNGLLVGYTHLLTGYVRSVSFLETILKVYEKLKQYNPNLIYVCDPVMGDAGKLYVPADLVPVFQEHVIPKASILTPNQFECQLLTGVAVDDDTSALKACDLIHSKGVPSVIITSIDYPSQPDIISLIASIVPVGSEADSTPQRFKISVPKLPKTFTGTGDLVAALLLAWSYKEGTNWAAVCEKVMSTMQAVLKRTMACGSDELRLIQSKRDIEDPSITCSAIMLPQ